MRRVAAARQVARRVARISRRVTWALRLYASRALDVRYCSAQAGWRLTRWGAAWWVSASLTGRTPNPLVEPTWLSPDSSTDPWMVGFLRRSILPVAVSPVFVSARDTRPIASVAQCLRAGGTAALPVAIPGAAGLSLADVRKIAFSSAEEAAAQQARARTRTRHAWDASRERAFWRDLPKVPPELEPLVTVVMAVRDGAPTVGDAIASVRAQTWSRWRLIVVDDGSQDDTVERVTRAAEGDPRIELHRTAPRGVAAARNTGISQATSPVLAFLDADNTWVADFLRGAVCSLLDSDAAIAYSGLRIRHDDGVTRYVGEQVTYADLRDGGNVVDLNAMVVRRGAVLAAGGFDERLRRWVDYDLVLRVLRTSTAVFCPFIGVDYDHRASRTDRITTRESNHWREVVLASHLVDWSAQTPRRIAGRLSLIVVLDHTGLGAVAQVESMLATYAGRDCEIVIVDQSEDPSFARVLRLAFARRPVVVLRLPRPHGFALSANLGFQLSSGQVVGFSSSTHLKVVPADDVTELQRRESALGAVYRVSADGLSLAVSARDFARSKGFDPALPEVEAAEDIVTRIGDAGAGVLRGA